MTPPGSELLLHTYLVVGGGTLLIYDYALTFSMEVERFWTPHLFSPTSVFYFTNRYTALLGYMPILYQLLGPVNQNECHFFQGYTVVYVYLVLMASAALMVIRVYALFDRDLVVAWTLGAYLILNIILCVLLRQFGALKNEPTTLTESRCVPYRTEGQGEVLAILWGLKQLFEIVVLLLTARKYSKFKQSTRPVLIDKLMTDEILSFSAGLVINTMTICCCIWAPPHLRVVGSPLNTATFSLTVSRITLNLRDPGIVSRSVESLSGSTLESQNVVTTILGPPTPVEDLRSGDGTESNLIALRTFEGQRGD